MDRSKIVALLLIGELLILVPLALHGRSHATVAPRRADVRAAELRGYERGRAVGYRAGLAAADRRVTWGGYVEPWRVGRFYLVRVGRAGTGRYTIESRWTISDGDVLTVLDGRVRISRERAASCGGYTGCYEATG